MQPYDACRLICLNFFSFVNECFTEKSSIDYKKLYEVSYEMQLMADDLVDLEIEAIDKIIKKIEDDPQPEEVKSLELSLWNKIKDVASSGRRTGNGFTGLGDMFAGINIKYGSDESLKILELVMQTKMKAELNATIDMAEKYGHFKGWDHKKEFDFNNWGSNDFYAMLANKFPKEMVRMSKYGRRNVSWSTVAPTGSVSILAEVTSGLEPLFQPYYTRRKKVNPGDKNVQVDFTDQNGDSWQEYTVLHSKFKKWIEVKSNSSVFADEISPTDLQAWFKESPWCGSTANDIDWEKRVEMQSIIQTYTSHSISSTLNLPETVSKREVAKIYMHSYRSGLKGVTIYRDNSRSGVLITKKEKEGFVQKNAPKRPEKINCRVHQTVYDNNRWLVIVGLLEDKPYEVFCVPNYYELPLGSLDGFLSKKNKGVYFLEVKKDELAYTIENVVAEMTAEQEVITRLISTSLRHGANIKFIVEQLSKTSGGITAFSNSISRVLKMYIPEGEKSTLTFEDCIESESCDIIFEEGCVKCNYCAKTKC